MPSSIDDLLNQIFSNNRFHLSSSSDNPTKKPSTESSDSVSRSSDRSALSAEELRRQADEMEALNQQVMADLAEMTRQLEVDAMLSPASPSVQNLKQSHPSATASTPKDGKEMAAAFDGLFPALGSIVLGQEAFLRDLITAFKRPFVMGTEANRARNAILIRGGMGTGRHTAVTELTRLLCQRGVFSDAAVGRMDLSLYPTQSEQRLFLQDLYGLLQSNAQVLVFDHFHQCHPAFLHSLSTLTATGRLPLSSRYVLQKGILVEAGTALTTDAVSALTLSGQFLIFITELSESQVAGSFGAEFLNALGDLLATGPFATSDLIEISRRHLSALQKKCLDRLDFTLQYDSGEAIPRYFASRFSEKEGVPAILAEVARCYRAFAELRLNQTETKPLTITLSAPEGRLLYDLGQGPQPVERLLPAAYTGALEAVRAEIRSAIGLSNVKDYILSLEENVKVQKMREAQGMKTSRTSMHMIFTGNPGTGKTTMARLVGKYLKAIGVLSGGQLVEVTRADLVGRYVGHTAPLTTQVIRSALGGVLFIDEAYALYRGQEDSFGLEAIDTLVKGMEDHRDDLVVILAGYSKEMEQFLTANSGLASRFPNIIEFPDYTGPELMQIARSIALGKGYRLDASVDEPLTTYFDTIQALNARESGNGRMARNKVEEAILNQSRRILAEGTGELDLLLPGDFDLLPPEQA